MIEGGRAGRSEVVVVVVSSAGGGGGEGIADVSCVGWRRQRQQLRDHISELKCMPGGSIHA